MKRSTLLIGKVSIQKDILGGKLGSAISLMGGQEETRQESDLVKNRSEYERRKIGSGKRKRPLLTSTEWVRIQIHKGPDGRGGSQWIVETVGSFGPIGFSSSAAGAYKR